jgi:hypothetical protein
MPKTKNGLTIHYEEDDFRISYKDGILSRHELGKASVDVAFDPKDPISKVINQAEKWIKEYELCT